MLTNKSFVWLLVVLSFLILHTQCKQDKDTPDSCSGQNGLPKIIDKEPSMSNRLKLECLASYPIEWDIHENNKNAMMVRQHVITNGDIFNNKMKCYNSTLVAYSSELNAFTRTGNYTCRSTADKYRSSSIYKFIFDKGLLAYPSSEFFNDKIEVREVLTMKNGEFIIPCRSNVEHVNASLSKIETPKVLLLTMNDYVRYDPKVGFIINSTNFPFNPLGEYECELFIEHTSERNSAIINLIHGEETRQYEVNPNTNHVAFSSTDHTKKFICLAKEDVYLDISNSESELQTFINHKESPIFEKALAQVNNKTSGNQFHYKASATIKPKPFGKGQVFCKTSNNHSILHTWNFDLQKSCECKWTNTLPLPTKNPQSEESFEVWDDIRRTVKGTIECTTPNRSVYSSVEFHPCHNPTECDNSVICPEKERYCSSHNYYDRDIIEYFDPNEGNAYINNASQQHHIFFKQLHSGVLECTIDQYIYRKKAYIDLDILVFRPEDMKNDVNVTKLEQFVFKKDPQVFKCEIVTFYLSGDLRWAFMYKSNSKMQKLKFIDPSSQIRVVQQAVANKLISTITLEMGDSEVESVYCFAPVWGSTTNEWKNASVSITVEGSDSEEYITETRPRHKCQEEIDTKMKTPSIFMERYTETDTKNFSSLWKATNKEFVLRQWKLKKRITLVCRANYPIEWFFDRKKMNSTFKMIETAYQIKSTVNTHMCFETKIVIYDTITKVHGFDSIMHDSTGKYICASTHHDEKQQSSTYIYRFYDLNFPLINHGQHINLEIESHKRKSDSWTTFPCRVSHPNVDVSLYTIRKGKYTELKKSEKIKFIPSEGFSVHNSQLELSDQYICTTKLNDESHTVSFSIVDKVEVDYSSPKSIRNDTEEDNSKMKAKGRSGRSNLKSKFLVVSIVGGVLVLALVVVILFMFRAIRNQQKTIKVLNDGFAVSYTTQQRLRETNPAFMEDVDIANHDRTVRPSSNYERF